jgi:hypothetical protein
MLKYYSLLDEIGGSKFMKLFLPMVIILSALVANVVNFVFPSIVGRPVIVMWFLFVCPGLVLIRFLKLKEPIVEWTLAIALSLATDSVVASIQMYTGHWSPSVTLLILTGFCIVVEFVQFALLATRYYKGFNNYDFR